MYEYYNDIFIKENETSTYSVEEVNNFFEINNINYGII
tara:strand:- start:302 stop:415 length:114 start_codon:yes stop_codon:yes gene_type:complete